MEKDLKYRGEHESVRLTSHCASGTLHGSAGDIIK